MFLPARQWIVFIQPGVCSPILKLCNFGSAYFRINWDCWIAINENLKKGFTEKI